MKTPLLHSQPSPSHDSLLDSVKQALQRVDALDSEGFATHFSADGAFIFGNAPAIYGRNAVQDSVKNFLSTLASIEHRIESAWGQEDSVAIQGTVTYVRPDGKKLSLPFANVIRANRSGQFTEWRIFADISPLFS